MRPRRRKPKDENRPPLLTVVGTVMQAALLEVIPPAIDMSDGYPRRDVARLPSFAVLGQHIPQIVECLEVFSGGRFSSFGFRRRGRIYGFYDATCHRLPVIIKAQINWNE